MKNFIEQYQNYTKEAERYLAGIYNLQDEFDVELELGWIEYSYNVDALVIDDGKLRIQVYKNGYYWGGVSDDLIDMPEDIDAKLIELRERCEAAIAKKKLEQEERNERERVERDYKEQQEFLRLKSKFEGK